MPSINYSYLTLKPEYREQFLQKARARFPGRYIKGTREAVNELLEPDESRISDDTIRRILTIDGYRGLADRVDAVCSLFGLPWYEACIEGDNLAEIETSPLLLTIAPKGNASASEVAAELATLCKALNAYHIACGGNGLEIDDWETLVADRELVEV
ncbi:hypothetical protein D0962_34420 [Leptolyngbyaceae cyanobacterium CCMR0082]|uniref:Uncharacterized protein n=1 Tax=Adonisia turfae CCMR0082 TaxID=2304604 RepID=A0A6M0SH25_9CYAN|nr:hypothetical protein [Adonisia turfae]NEZ67795.1 hypothetical protein [Adonisia turfae CCMR0082]